jgi:hypothetical protein
MTLTFVINFKKIITNNAKGIKYYSTYNRLISNIDIAKILEMSNLKEILREFKELNPQKQSEINSSLDAYYKHAYNSKLKDFNGLTTDNLDDFLNQVNLLYKDFIVNYLFLSQNTLSLPSAFYR